MKKDKTEIEKYINNLVDYKGYIQYSNRPINKDRDIFINKDPKVEYKDGFIYEAHFYNGKDTITIKQINEYWLVDETKDTPLSDIQSYYTKFSSASASQKGGAKAPIPKTLRVKMAQIWEEEEDELCEGMKVKRLKKVIFAGFENG